MAISIVEESTCNSCKWYYYVVNIHGHSVATTVTSSRRVANLWIRKHLLTPCPRCGGYRHKTVGLDIEWRPSRTRGSRNPVAIIQLCIKKACLIFQLYRASSVPKSLYKALENPHITYTGVKISDDAEKLEEDYGLEIANFEDIPEMAAEIYGCKKFKREGLKTFVRLLMDEELDKRKDVALSNWEAETLCRAQVQYACADAYYSYKCGEKLLFAKDLLVFSNLFRDA